jgi:ABC-type dipeptide/oligopeptide/nickel transport system permease subunit
VSALAAGRAVPTAATFDDPAPRRPSIARRLARDVPAMLALGFLAAVVLMALGAPLIAPHDPYANAMRLRLRPPGGDFLLGTDSQGRDMLTRLLYGARTTLLVGFTAVAFGGFTGACVGILSAYYRRVDAVAMRVVDVLLSFPSILFGLAIAAVLGAGMKSLVLALSIAAIPTVARIARAAATVVMHQEYVDAGRALGLGDGALIVRYVTMNCVAVIAVYLTLQLGQTILLGAALSFLGLGAQPPTAELGSMAAEGRRFLSIAPHVATLPSAVIFAIVLAFNVLGDALRDVLDPRLRQ